DSTPEPSDLLNFPEPPDFENGYVAALETQFGSNLTAPQISGINLKSAEDSYGVTSDPLLPDESYGVAQSLSSSSNTFRGSEEFNIPFVLAFQLNKRLKKRWSLGGGLAYTLMTSTDSYSNEDFRRDERIRRQYIGLVTSFNYEFVQRKRYAMYATTGLQYDFGTRRTRDIREFRDGELEDEYQVSNDIRNQASINVGMGFNVGLTNRLSAYMQGNLTHYFFRTHYNLWSQSAIWPVGNIGLRLQL
ncbi:MAG: hypothetical protein AAF570_28445, partial [Bacteroidota bacterium]